MLSLAYRLHSSQIHLIYNKFVSAISYEAETIKILSKDALLAGGSSRPFSTLSHDSPKRSRS